MTQQNRMLRLALLAVPLLGFALPTVTLGQEFPVVEPKSQHQWLQKFVGKWTTVSKSKMAEGQPAMEMAGTIESETVGNLWLINTMKGEVGGFQVHGRQTIGYSESKQCYIGTWIDNSSEFMWHYKGTVKDDKILALEAEGPDMSDPDKTALYKDQYEFLNDDKIRFTSSVKSPDGQWIDFMEGIATRQK